MGHSSPSQHCWTPRVVATGTSLSGQRTWGCMSSVRPRWREAPDYWPLQPVCGDHQKEVWMGQGGLGADHGGGRSTCPHTVVSIRDLP